MKKIVSILVLVLAVTFSAQAQKKGKKGSAEKQVEKTLKKMTADLDLTTAQQNEIKPLLIAQIADRKEMMKSRKAMRDSGEKPSKEAMKEMRKARKSKEKEMNEKMKAILSESQFSTFEKMQKKGKEKIKKGISN
ncbi:Spy/CpxP family protein refolding chaperone [Polaribacter haliotis]|uniref:Spy/CpxP family protein refolding chaperone n=1 Tax=Polaribacter haliotis TaxID=1888915 RepID=A0A7L8AKR0_9FLAO|nr:Spy/CpxP family protein refolding chaperone [Polaribacter haliotis]QOD62379.1 Spy/CpxP family protein refolding chaperone [Polaribacter haliotis]